MIVETFILDVLETPSVQYLVRPSGDRAMRNVLATRLQGKSFVVSQASVIDESSAS